MKQPPKKEETDGQDPAEAKPAAAPTAKPLRTLLAREMERIEERQRQLGSSGPASNVRRVDPKDYVPAPSSKPPRMKR